MIVRFIIAVILLLPTSPAFAQFLTLHPGEALTEDDVIGLLDLELADGRNHRQSVDLSSPTLPMRNKARQPVAIALTSIEIDRDGERVIGKLTAALPSGETSDIQIAGRITEEVRIPVIDRHVQPGDVIQEGDLSSAWMPENRVPHRAVLTAEQIVGAEVRRRLRPGRPVEAGDLRQPRLVRRGEAVEVIYRHGGLMLSALAEALDDGTLGQLVRLSNLDSGRRFAARVEGRKLAVIDAGLAGTKVSR